MKIQHDGLDKKLKYDIFTLEQAAKAMSYFFSIDLLWIVPEFESSITEEMGS